MNAVAANQETRASYNKYSFTDPEDSVRASAAPGATTPSVIVIRSGLDMEVNDALKKGEAYTGKILKARERLRASSERRPNDLALAQVNLATRLLAYGYACGRPSALHESVTLLNRVPCLLANNNFDTPETKSLVATAYNRRGLAFFQIAYRAGFQGAAGNSALEGAVYCAEKASDIFEDCHNVLEAARSRANEALYLLERKQLTRARHALRLAYVGFCLVAGVKEDKARVEALETCQSLYPFQFDNRSFNTWNPSAFSKAISDIENIQRGMTNPLESQCLGISLCFRASATLIWSNFSQAVDAATQEALEHRYGMPVAIVVTARAETDLHKVWLWACKKFGEKAADRYLDTLDQRVTEYSLQPLRRQIYCTLCKTHSPIRFRHCLIFYSTSEDSMIIERVVREEDRS